MIDYNKYLNKTIREIPMSPIEKISIMAAQTKDCILLGVGEPDFRTPWRIKGQNLVQPGAGSAAAETGYLRLSETPFQTGLQT